MSRVTIRLTLDVTYKLNNTHTAILEDNLQWLAEHASLNGSLSAGTDAEVVVFSCLAEVLP